MIILDCNVLEIDTRELHNVKVDMTMIDGVVEYERV
jgi:predicted amidohydrolase YtcJ